MDKKTFVVSDESINDKGFKVLTAGIDTTDFLNNPLMLWMHERGNVIGKWENVRVENGKMLADPVFDVGTDQGAKIGGQVERGFLKCASIGVVPIEWQGDVVTKSMLFEISICDVGSNKNAVVLYEDKPEAIRLSMADAQTSQTLIKTLGLTLKAGSPEIIQAVIKLQTENVGLTQELSNMRTQVLKDQQEEASRLTGLAIKLNIIPGHLANLQKLAFERDFKTARNDLQKLIDDHQEEQKITLTQTWISSAVEASKNVVKGYQDRSKWTLTDYRKFAPKELEKNPELYQELLKAEFKK